MRNIAIGLFALFSASACLAAPQNVSLYDIEGQYKGYGLSVSTIVLDSESKQIAVSSVVTSGACSGSVAGIGTLAGNTLRFKPYKAVEGGENCSITILFRSKGKSATVTESECTSYHGAACGWEGQSVSKVREP